ncbi:PucR family transcriptional regulator [Nocardia sp. NPDC101769]|uniref:PucR family transcriptional regulator n=1 Tax=Nocardia sp. NPDC101769 TaxID=3364333 RepID=UPI0037FAC982
MEPEWPPAQEPAARQAWRTVLRPIAAELRAAAAELSQQMSSVFAVELPHVFPDDATLAENQVSTEASVLALAQMIERGGDPRSVELPAATAAIARSGVWRQLPLADLLRTYRFGHELGWQWIFGRIATLAKDSAELVVAADLASRWLFAYIDATVTRAATVYDDEREHWLRSAMAARGEAIEDIVARRETDIARASTRLRYDLRRHHIGVLAWLDTPSADDDAQTMLARAVTDLAEHVHADPPLIYPSGVLSCTGWLSRGTAFIEAELAALACVRLSGVRVAAGEPGAGLTGFRRTHLEATQARRVAILSPTATALTRYADVALAALTSVDAELAGEFVARVLGPLAAPDAGTRRLAETLAVFLDENRSRSRAAARLNVHPNTVNYRVRQAEQLLGRSVDTASLDLRAALAMLAAVGGQTSH